VLLVDGARNAHGRVEWWTMGDLLSELTSVRSVGEKLNAPGWLPVEMVGDSTHRHLDNVAKVWALVCDLDDDLEDFDALSQGVHALGYAAVIHTTWSHSPEHAKARVVFPLEEACTAEQWPVVWASGAAWAKTWGATIDKVCKDPSRLYFLPAVDARDERRAGWFRADVVDGRPCLSWRWLVANHRPPKEKRIPPPPPLTGAGLAYDELDKEKRRRRAFALAVLERRAGLVRTAGSGKGVKGRNVYCYTGGRAVGQLVAAGVLSEAEGYHALVNAAMAAGLKAKEADRAVRNGIHKGMKEGAWDFSQNS